MRKADDCWAAGTLFLAPYALMSLLWVGIGPPWEATVEENEMRYLVLMGMTAAIVGGFAVIKEALSEAGEHASGVVRDHASGSAFATIPDSNPAKHAMTGSAPTAPSGTPGAK